MLRITGVAALLLSVVAVACSSGAGTTPVPTSPPATPTPAAPSAAPPTAAAGPTVALSSQNYFVGPNGMTLYTFDNDTADVSNCSGQCASTWPVLTVASADSISLGSGLAAADFGTITRSDGSLQVTFNHAPLYYFSGDTQPGDTNGVYSLWRLATPDSVPGVPSAEPSASSAAGNPVVSLSDAGVLVGPNGMTLYTFDNDAPDTSTCTDQCESNWPVLGAPASGTISVGDGLSAAEFATITRSDGSLQVTYDGQPLYYFAGDQAAGDTNGDGIGGVWHVAVSGAVPPPSPTPTSTGEDLQY